MESFSNSVSAAPDAEGRTSPPVRIRGGINQRGCRPPRHTRESWLLLVATPTYPPKTQLQPGPPQPGNPTTTTTHPPTSCLSKGSQAAAGVL